MRTLRVAAVVQVADVLQPGQHFIHVGGALGPAAQFFPQFAGGMGRPASALTAYVHKAPPSNRRILRSSMIKSLMRSILETGSSCRLEWRKYG